MATQMPQMPGATPDKIVHSCLTKGGLVIMAADMMDPTLLFTKEDTVSLCLVCESKQEIEAFFRRLSVGGEVSMALKTPFGWYAQFTDQFGTEWMLQFDGE